MAVELQKIDRAGLHQSPGSPARDLALSRSQWNSGVQLEPSERVHIVVPVERLFQPSDIQIVKLVGSLNGCGQIPPLIGVKHQPHVGAYQVPNCFDAVVVILNAVATTDSTHFELNCVETLLDVTSNLFEALFDTFTRAIVAARNI